MGSLKGQCATSYRSLIETIALDCLVFEKIAFFFAFWRQTDRQINILTDKQTDKGTNRWTAPIHYAALAIASGGLIAENWVYIRAEQPIQLRKVNKQR